MTDQPEVTPQRPAREIPYGRGELDALRQRVGVGAEDFTQYVIDRLLVTIDHLNAELTVSEERCKFVCTQVTDLVAAGDSDQIKIRQLRAKVAELEARTLDDVQFRALLDLLMCSDPWPVSDKLSELPVICFATDQAKARGYADWISAYHEFKVSESNEQWAHRRAAK